MFYYLRLHIQCSRALGTFNTDTYYNYIRWYIVSLLFIVESTLLAYISTNTQIYLLPIYERDKGTIFSYHVHEIKSTSMYYPVPSLPSPICT